MHQGGNVPKTRHSILSGFKAVRELDDGEIGPEQTWESVKPGVPKEVKDGYPEIKILGVG